MVIFVRVRRWSIVMDGQWSVNFKDCIFKPEPEHSTNVEHWVLLSPKLTRHIALAKMTIYKMKNVS